MPEKPSRYQVAMILAMFSAEERDDVLALAEEIAAAQGRGRRGRRRKSTNGRRQGRKSSGAMAVPAQMAEGAAVPKRRGRPPGTKNKPKAEAEPEPKVAKAAVKAPKTTRKPKVKVAKVKPISAAERKKMEAAALLSSD